MNMFLLLFHREIFWNNFYFFVFEFDVSLSLPRLFWVFLIYRVPGGNSAEILLKIPCPNMLQIILKKSGGISANSRFAEINFDIIQKRKEMEEVSYCQKRYS